MEFLKPIQFSSFQDSVSRFQEILHEPKTVANRDSAIKRFELTFELSWKTLQKYLKSKGVIPRSPKDTFKEAFSQGMIADDPLWIKMIEDRNLTVHTYDETLADKIYDHLKNYLGLFDSLKDKLKSLI